MKNMDEILDDYCPECDIPVDEYGREIKDKIIFKPEVKDGKGNIQAIP